MLRIAMLALCAPGLVLARAHVREATPVTAFEVALPDSAFEAIARRAAELVLERFDDGRGESEYLTVTEAAKFLRAKPQRVYDLLSAGRLTRHKDGSRVLVSRAELVAHLLPSSGRRLQARIRSGVAA